MDASDVLSQVRDAFPVDPMPGTTLRQGQLADETLSREITPEEWEAEGAKDRGVIWTAIEVSALLECEAALSHLDEDAFVYYLPAFICFAIRHLDSPDHDHASLVGATVFAVTHRSNYNLSRLKRLSDAQIDAVISFLRLIRDGGGFDATLADKALQRYWETPDARRPTLIQLP
jgi:hypothetical protein